MSKAAQADGLLPTPAVDAPVGDGSLGILEAPLSIIRHDGSQLQSVARRGDCTGESAMALAFGGKVFGDAQMSRTAGNLLDFWYFTSGEWLGFHGDDPEAVIDLEEALSVRQIAARFRQSTAVGIYLPAEVEIAISEDGQQYRTVATTKPVVGVSRRAVQVRLSLRHGPGPLQHRGRQRPTRPQAAGFRQGLQRQVHLSQAGRRKPCGKTTSWRSGGGSSR